MSAELVSYPAWVVAVLAIAAMLAVTFPALILVRRFVAVERLREHNDVAGFIFSAVAVMYAVLLAFVVIVVWEQFGKAEDIVQAEVSATDSLYQEVEAYPSGPAREIRREIVNYATATLCDDWPKMQTGAQSGLADESLTRLTKLVELVDPRGQRDHLVYADSLVLVHVLLTERDKRLDVNSRGIPSIMWWTLIAGAAVTLAFTLFFGAGNVRVHFLFAGLFAAVIGVMFALIVELNFPFRGSTSVTPLSWRMLIQRIQTHAGAGLGESSSGLRPCRAWRLQHHLTFRRAAVDAADSPHIDESVLAVEGPSVLVAFDDG